jgi:hypothetical protein
VRRRAASISLWVALPLIAVGAIIAYRYLGATFCASYAAAALMLILVVVLRELRAYDAPWLLRRLNATLPACEDSAELLLGVGSMGGAAGTAAAGATVPRDGGLVALQRARLLSRLETLSLPELRPGYPRRALALAWAGAVLLLAVALAAPLLSRVLQGLASNGAPAARAGVVGEVSLRVVPPSYTQLATQNLSSLDAKVPEGSTVGFALHLAGDPVSAALSFHDGSRLDLHRDGDVWRGERVFAASTLYRVALNGEDTAERLYRLDVIPDRAPELLVRTPDHTLNLLTAAQKTWDLAFEASDDYGLVKAELAIALAQGSGENIKTTQQTIVLEGEGDAHHRLYRKTLDLAALGFAQGDDLVVRLRVSDNRPGQANLTQSASFILRWPAQAEAASSGMEGLVQKTLPAYFASERQIIVDSEALQADRGRIEAKRFEARSDELGVEQKTLRLRYGEFLGEESEHSAQHDDDTQSTSKGFGDAGNITSEYGHVHDRPEAATLLDPDTRRILKAALDEMWQAELHLRQADPGRALPYEYKALEYIKQVQQAERIYLARAGVQLPQTDPSRRLTGDRSGLSDRGLGAAKASVDDAPIAAIWQSLHAGSAPDWARLNGWVRAHQRSLPDALGLLAAADHVQRDPACASCRAELLGLLWPLLPAPGAALEPRRQPDAAGAAYLQALAGSSP